jgi:hypothetical protein
MCVCVCARCVCARGVCAQCVHTRARVYVQCDAQNAKVIQIYLLLGNPHLNSGFLQTIMAI